MMLAVAKATRRLAKVDLWSEIQHIAQSALHLIHRILTQGIVSTSSKRYSHLAGSLIYVSMRSK